MSTYGQTYGETASTDDTPLVSRERLSHLALLVVVAIAVCRGTILEILRDPLAISPAQAYTPIGAGPSTIVCLNLLCAVPVILVLLRRAVSGEWTLVRTFGPVVWILLGGLATASAAWASDRYSALLTGSTWLAAGGVCWATAQVVRDWAHFRLVVAALVGMLLVYDAQGLYYHYVELPDTQAMVRQDEDKLLAERGFTKGTFAADAFIQRIMHGEMVGFGASPNTYAAVLVMLGVTGVGMVIDGIRRRRDPVLLFFLVAGLAAAVWCGVYARSRTSAATPVLAALAVGAVVLLKRVGVRSHLKLFVIGLGGCLLVGAAVIGHGLYHHSLPTDSMNFRWRYWTAAWTMFEQRPWLGSGWANFLSSYLPVRLPAAAEEIRDPHNFFVRFATELGLAGLSLAVVWMLFTWWDATRGVTARQLSDDRGTALSQPDGYRLGIASLMFCLVLGMLLNTICSVDFSSPWVFIVLECFKRLMFLGVLIVGSSLVYIVSRSDARADTSSSIWTLRFAGAGVGVFLVHNLVDFSLFENAPMFLFALLLGAVIGVRSESTASRVEEDAHPVRRISAGLGALFVTGLGLAYLVWPGLPVIAAEAKLREGDEFLRTSRVGEGPLNTERIQQSARAYREAFELMPLNAAYAAKAAGAWSVARSNVQAIRELLDLAMAADPLAIQPMLDRARLEQQVQPEIADLATAVRLFARVVELNPTDVVLRIEYAALLERVGRTAQAAEQLRTALAYNDQLDPKEPKRLPPDQLAQTQAKLKELEARLLAGPTTR
jgi:hypothetical protein